MRDAASTKSGAACIPRAPDQTAASGLIARRLTERIPMPTASPLSSKSSMILGATSLVSAYLTPSRPNQTYIASASDRSSFVSSFGICHRALRRASEQLSESGVQRWQVVFDDAPDELWVPGSVGVDQHVAEGDDARQVRDACSERRVDAPEVDESFADNLELSLDGGAQHVVGQIIVEAAVGSEPRDPLGRTPRVPKQLGASSPIMEGKAAASQLRCGG